MYKIYCDGASRSNPGEASIGVSVTKEGNEIEFIAQKMNLANVSNSLSKYFISCKLDIQDLIFRRGGLQIF